MLNGFAIVREAGAFETGKAGVSALQPPFQPHLPSCMGAQQSIGTIRTTPRVSLRETIALRRRIRDAFIVFCFGIGEPCR